MPLPDPSPDHPFRVPDDSLGFLLWRVTHAWQRFVDDRLEACGLTHLQFALMAALGWLTRHGEPTTQGDLIGFVAMHPMQVSQVLSTLERKDQITRDRHPVDGRTKRVALTASGSTALGRAMPMVEAAHASFFGRDDAVAADLRTILRDLAARHSQ